MFDSPNYPVVAADVDAFIAEARHGTLIATPPGGSPQISLLPFVKTGDVIELHCVQGDPTFAAVCANPRVTFLLSDFLAFSPHDWVNERDAGRATLHFRAVAFEGEAAVSTEPTDVAAALAKLLRAYEPDAGYEAIDGGGFYGPRLRRLATIRIAITATHAKFKTGPAAPAEVKREVARKLRERAEPNDARAADVIERYLR